MKIAYGNISDEKVFQAGSSAHSTPLIEALSRSGVDVWTWPPNTHPDVKILPPGLRKANVFADCSCLLFRCDFQPPNRSLLKWVTRPLRFLYPRTKIYFEFNQVPEYGLSVGCPAGQVEAIKAEFRRLSQHIDGGVCVSDNLRTYYQDLGMENLQTIDNGADAMVFDGNSRPCYTLSQIPTSLKLCWLGTSKSPENDFIPVIQAAKTLWEAGRKEVSFHFLGNIHLRDYELPPSIYLHGMIPRRFLPQWLAACNIGVLTYDAGKTGMFSSPLKLFDYLAGGLSIVSYPHPVVQKVIDTAGLEGQCILKQDAQSLVDSIMFWLHNPEILKSNQEKSRRAFLEYFTWDHAARRLISFVNRPPEQAESQR